MVEAVRAVQIINVLARNDAVGDRAICKALVHLYNRQLRVEQIQQDAIVHNNRGFRKNDARMGTSMAEQYLKFGRLSEKQLNYWRVKNRKGKMRIAVYWRQLLDEAWKKQGLKALAE